jgi:hypothetical protein
MAKTLPSLTKLLLSLLFLLGVRWAEAQVSAQPAAPQPGPSQQPDPGTPPGSGLPGAPSGGLVRPAPAPTGLGGNVNGVARQSPAGNALLAPAPQAIGAGMSGFGGFPAPAATGQPGFGTGAGMFGTLAPVTVRGDLTQPGIAGPGLGPVQPGGVGLPLITTSSGAQLANTGTAPRPDLVSAHSRNAANVSPVAAHCRPPAWTVPRPASNLWQLGPPYGVMAEPQGARGRLVGTVRPAPIALGALHSDETAVRTGRPHEHRPPADLPAALEILLFKLGKVAWVHLPNASRRAGAGACRTGLMGQGIEGDRERSRDQEAPQDLLNQAEASEPGSPLV